MTARDADGEGRARLAVIGANGRTGGRVVRQAVSRGYEVVAVARAPATSLAGMEGVQVVAGDALDRDAMRAAVAGCDAVVSALGVGTSRKPTTVYSGGVGNVLAAMEAHDVGRIVVVSAAPVGPSSGHPPFQRRVLLPVLRRFLGAQYADMERMEAALRASDVDWVSLRPPRLIDKPGRGTYRLDIDAPLRGGGSLRCDDLATALLDALDDGDLSGTTAYVAN